MRKPLDKRHRDHHRPAPDRDRAPTKAAILVSLSRGATRADACDAAGVPRCTFYNWIGRHASFHNAVEDAELKPVALAEAVALRCALKAEQDPRYLRALFHFLRHRAGRGEKPRREPEPHEGRSNDTPDPGRDLIPALRARLEPGDLPPAAGTETPGPETEMEFESTISASPPSQRGARHSREDERTTLNSPPSQGGVRRSREDERTTLNSPPSQGGVRRSREGVNAPHPHGLTDEELDDWAVRTWLAAAHAQDHPPDVPSVPSSAPNDRHETPSTPSSPRTPEAAAPIPARTTNTSSSPAASVCHLCHQRHP